jgi:hypothetical protein
MTLILAARFYHRDALSSVTRAMRHRFDPARGIFIHELTGSLDLARFKAVQIACYVGDDLSQFRNVLWDIGECTLLFSYADIVRDDAPFMRTLADRRPHGRTAFATSSKTNRIVLHDLERAHAWTTEWRYFDTAADALPWLTRE